MSSIGLFVQIAGTPLAMLICQKKMPRTVLTWRSGCVIIFHYVTGPAVATTLLGFFQYKFAITSKDVACDIYLDPAKRSH